MQNLVGKVIHVYLKNDRVVSGKLNGVGDNVYIYDESKVYIIPYENVLYYAVDIDHNKRKTPEESTVGLYINDQYMLDIPIMPTINTKQWNMGLYQAIYGNPDVQSLLAGKEQVEASYKDGMINIVLREDDTTPLPQVQNSENTFTMKLGSPATQFMSPMQMVSRLNNIKKATEKQDDKET